MNEDKDELEKRIAVKNAGVTLEVLLQLFNAETENARQKIRQFGQKIRNFVNNQFNKKEIYAQSLIELALKSSSIEVESEADDEIWPKEIEKTYTIPSRTFVDLEFILLNDEEDGVISRLATKNPKWSKMPDYTPVITKETDSNQFQLWNRPLGSPCAMPEDDDERLSLPSTRATEWGTDKMSSVETQLAILTKQMQHLLQLQQNNAKTRSKSPTADSSEDEGRGTSLPSLLCSPLSGRKNITEENKSNKIASVAPPKGPPPPPPPPGLLKPIENKINIIETKAEKTSTYQRPLRPTADELLKVQLRKVEARSPGGTPHGKTLKRAYDALSNQDSLFNALQNRFRAFNGHNSELDETDNRDESWNDD